MRSVSPEFASSDEHSDSDNQARRWEVRLGSSIDGPEGRIGIISGLVLAPDGRSLTGLVVHRPDKTNRTLPFPGDLADGRSGRAIRSPLPPSRLPFAWGNQPTVGSMVLAMATSVRASAGVVGRLALLLVAPNTGKVTDLVLRSGLLRHHMRIIPFERATTVNPARIVLDLARSQLDAFPEFRSDADVTVDVTRAFQNDDLLRILDARWIHVGVRDGVVTLSGYVSGGAQRAQAEAIAWKIPGVLAVANQLVTNWDLAVAVAGALASDSRTRAAIIPVQTDHGSVTLQMRSVSGEIRDAARNVASAVSGVRGVSDSGQATRDDTT